MKVPPSEEQRIEAFDRVIKLVAEQTIDHLFNHLDLIELADAILELFTVLMQTEGDEESEQEKNRKWAMAYLLLGSYHMSNAIEEASVDSPPE